MDRQLVYDVGAHLGEDTDFYLRSGFKVVAIEGNPALIERLKERFRSNLCDGSLSLIDAAIAESAGEVDFYVNRSYSVWGTIRPKWAERNAFLGSPSEIIKVKAITFPEVLTEHGIPYYLKIDIEGADLLCLEGLLHQPDRPRFISIEADKREWNALLHEFEMFRRLGYSRFKIVDQTKIGQQEQDSSGVFGEQLPGRWLTPREAIRQYGLIFVRHWLFGDFGRLRFVRKFPVFGKMVVSPWYDTHAALQNDPVGNNPGI